MNKKEMKNVMYGEFKQQYFNLYKINNPYLDKLLMESIEEKFKDGIFRYMVNKLIDESIEPKFDDN